MENILFERRANVVARAILVKGNEKLATKQIMQEFNELSNYLGSLLLQHDSVCISVYGENLPAVLLLNFFGYDGLLKIIDQKGIFFHLQNSMITHIVSHIQGVNPLQAGKLNSGVHVDPQASVEAALSFSRYTLMASQRKNLVKQLSDSYLSPSIDFAPQAVDFAQKGYESNRFNTLNFPQTEELQKLNLEEKEKLNQIATEMFILSIISDLGLETYNTFQVTKVLSESFKNIEKAHKKELAVSRVFDIESVPNFFNLIKENVIDLKDIPDHRVNKNCIKFREWIKGVSDKKDAKDISREYIDSITNKGFFESSTGRFSKTLAVSGLFGLAGGAIAGPLGAVAGGSAGPVVDFGLDLIDEFLLGNILKGWSPRNYINELQDLQKNRNN